MGIEHPYWTGKPAGVPVKNMDIIGRTGVARIVHSGRRPTPLAGVRDSGENDPPRNKSLSPLSKASNVHRGRINKDNTK